MIDKLYANQGNAYFPTDKSAFQNALPVGTYSVNFHPQKGYFFTKIEDMAVPSRCYGDVAPKANRILQTFDEREGATTGVLLAGLKGTGKTMLAKRLSQTLREQGISTFVVNEPHCGDAFNKLIQELGKCMVVFDEFEKVYNKRDVQDAMLTLLDGTFNSHKLVAITVNDPWGLNNHMQNRPGRILYSLEYGALGEDIIREYAADHLKDMSKLDGLLRAATLINEFTMDMLIAIVSEMNRFDETAMEALKWLNIRPPKDATYSVQDVVYKGKKLPTELARWFYNANPLMLPSEEGDEDGAELRILKKNKHGGFEIEECIYFHRENVKSYAGDIIVLENEGAIVTLKRSVKTFNYNWDAF